MASYKDYPMENVLKAIENSQGIVSIIAKRIGCKSETAENLIARWKETQKAYTSECSSVLDLAETVVIKDIAKGSVSTAKWYLALKGRERGYNPQPVIKLDPGTDPLNINLAGSGDMSREELEEARNVEIGGLDEGTGEGSPTDTQ